MSRLGKSLLAPAFTAFRRDLGDRHFTIIALAVVVAVASVTAVDLFTDRVRQALNRQSSALLAADLAITANHPLPAKFSILASTKKLKTSNILSMRSVVSSDDALQLVELKAVSRGYPLRGSVLLADKPFAKPAPATGIPPAGSVWVESRLLSLANTTLGARLKIGLATFTIDKILVLEPDRGGDLFNIAPRVMMNEADIPTTGLIAPGSRVRHTLLLAGTSEEIDAFRQDVTPGAGERIISPQDARPEIRAALHRAEQFLGLAALTTVILAGIAIALGARSYGEQHKDTVALLRTLGATRGYVLAFFALQLLLLGLVAGGLGTLIGAAAQEIIARSLSGWIQADLPAPSFLAALRAALVALLALAGFALPPLLQLRDVPPLRVLRSDADANPTRPLSVFFYAFAACIFLAPWRSGDWSIVLWSLLGLVVGMSALALAATILVKAVGAMRRHSGLVWRFGISNIARRGVLTIVQTAALGLGLMALLVLSIVRNDLLDSWISSLPPGAPNQFLINIHREDVPGLRTFFANAGLAVPSFYPMIRGRLTAINDTPVSGDSYADPRAQRLVDRDFNLSSASTLKPYNKLVAGHWWSDEKPPGQFSVERDIAETLGLSLGDTLRYRVADQDVVGEIVNLRAVQWDSMQVNFFVEAPPALLDAYPATYITSFHLSDTSYPLLRELVASYPSVTVIDVAALVNHVRRIMQRSAATIEFVFMFTLIAGVLVLVAAVQATQQQRVFESALLKTLGASRRLCLGVMSVEFVVIGFVAGAIAGVVSLLSAWILARQVMDLDYAPDFSVIALGIAIGVIGVSIVGSFAIANALRRPAATVLRYRG